MSARKGLVLDANILIRAVFGTRVRSLLQTYEETASFFSPEVCFEDASQYIPDVAARRKIDASAGLATLEAIGQIVEVVDRSLYETHEQLARERVSPRDPEGLARRRCSFIIRTADLDRRSRLLRDRSRLL